jgi:hypothetical protein
MVKKIFLYTAGAFAAIVIYQMFLKEPHGCKLTPIGLVTDTVRYGLFYETIPLTGKAFTDSLTHGVTVVVPIDELYFAKVSVGQKAITTFDNADYALTLSSKDSLITDGRFTVSFLFIEDSVPALRHTGSVRIRHSLSTPSEAIQLSVGGFYKDTGGQWVYIVNKDQSVVKRHVKLGRKNPECFEVLDGLRPGEVVITSMYEPFLERESLTLSEIEKMYD